MKKNFLFSVAAALFTATMLFSAYRSPTHAPKPAPAIQLGAYYFDGWSKAASDHISPKLRDSFPDRRPKWGWVTSTPDIMKDQIDLAANAGLSFFSFCWYYPSYNHQHFQDDALNHALSLYLKSPNKNRLRFNLMVANHAGQEIGPADWDAVTDVWISLFKDEGYVKVGGKPLLTIFSVPSLVKLFGGTDAVKKAVDSLRDKATAAGLKGVSIAGCVSPTPESINQAKACGFDLVTGYNYPNLGFKDGLNVHNVDSLNNIGVTVWNRFLKSPLPYIPVATLNWDPRPWATPTNFYGRSVYYTGYNSNSVYKSIQILKNWINQNPGVTPSEHLAMLYAWNEYGEGAWLTPTENDTARLLDGIKRAVNSN